jgi:hypothetical protein
MTMTPQPSWAGLLEEYGTDPTKIQSTSSSSSSSSSATMVTPTTKQKDESVIEPNLRSNYYYPTNKKRYLPRIKRCSDAIPDAAASIGAQDWVAVETFATKIADDTILPMRLYTSSLTGGGTNVKVSYTKDMKYVSKFGCLLLCGCCSGCLFISIDISTQFSPLFLLLDCFIFVCCGSKCADDFEKNQKKLVAALQQRDQQASSEALENMATALQTYRTVGRLLGPDGGGDIPSTDEIRRAACRVQGRSFSKTIQARDARMGSSSSTTGATATTVN